MNAVPGAPAAPAAINRQSHGGKGDGMQQGGLDVLGPASWEQIETIIGFLNSYEKRGLGIITRVLVSDCDIGRAS